MAACRCAARGARCLSQSGISSSRGNQPTCSGVSRRASSSRSRTGRSGAALRVGVLRPEPVLVLDHASPQRDPPEHGGAPRPPEEVESCACRGARTCMRGRGPRAARMPGTTPQRPRGAARCARFLATGRSRRAVPSRRPGEGPGAPRDERFGEAFEAQTRPGVADTVAHAVQPSEGATGSGSTRGFLRERDGRGRRLDLARQRQRRGLDLDDALRLSDVHQDSSVLRVRCSWYRLLAPPGRSRASAARAARLAPHEPIDRVGVAEVDASVRGGLHGVHGVPEDRDRDGPPTTSVRAAFSATRCSAPPQHAPNNRSPSRVLPRPHPSQNAAPVMPIVLEKLNFGQPPGRRAVLVRVGAALARPPGVVAGPAHEVDLVVALRPVLGLPQPSAARGRT